MDIQVIKDTIHIRELKRIAKEQFGELVKAVVDIEQGKMAIGGELHADEEALLIEQEHAKPEHLWGINLYPDSTGEEFIEFDSMINLKPAFSNRSRDVEDIKVREKIQRIVEKLIIS